MFGARTRAKLVVELALPYGSRAQYRVVLIHAQRDLWAKCGKQREAVDAVMAGDMPDSVLEAVKQVVADLPSAAAASAEPGDSPPSHTHPRSRRGTPPAVQPDAEPHTPALSAGRATLRATNCWLTAHRVSLRVALREAGRDEKLWRSYGCQVWSKLDDRDPGVMWAHAMAEETENVTEFK